MSLISGDMMKQCKSFVNVCDLDRNVKCHELTIELCGYEHL